MRHWMPAATPTSHSASGVLAPVIEAMARADFPATLLQRLRLVVPGTSLSVYRTGTAGPPRRYMGASHRQPDTTRDCWRAYASGPWRRDQTLTQGATLAHDGPLVCHVTASEVSAEHRAKVYDAHAMAERVSVVRRDADASVFAINLYRHAEQRPFSDAQLAGFAELAPALLAITRKHLDVLGMLERGAEPQPLPLVRRQLQMLHPRLTARELDVCERILRGMTDEGIAADLQLGLPTVRTYRNRAFRRLGISFRNELFAAMRSVEARQ